MPSEDVTRFHPTSGRISGGVVIAVCVGVIVLTVVQPGGTAFLVAAIAALVAVIAWAAMLRPAVSMGRDTLRMRGMFSTTALPLASIEEVALRQVMAVRAGERRYVSPALGRPLRKIRAADRGRSKPKAASEVEYADLVDDTIRSAMESARARAGVGLLSDEQFLLATGVRRRPDPLPIALLTLAALAVLIAALMQAA